MKIQLYDSTDIEMDAVQISRTSAAEAGGAICFYGSLYSNLSLSKDDLNIGVTNAKIGVRFLMINHLSLTRLKRVQFISKVRVPFPWIIS